VRCLAPALPGLALSFVAARARTTASFSRIARNTLSADLSVYPMKTRHLIVVSILAGLGVSVGFSQALTPPPTKSGAAAANTPSPAPAKPTAAPKLADQPRDPEQGFSSGVSAAISAGMPKYSPPPKAPEPKPEEELPDLRDIDKPKNQIIRLPQVVVREPKNPILRERDIATKEGLAAIAMKRYILDSDRALNSGSIPLFGTSNEKRALAMYAEDERLKNMADLNEAAGLVSATDKAAGAYVKREARNTYMRTGDFGWRSPSSREDRGINDAANAPR
jgi:hypothetical protein